MSKIEIYFDGYCPESLLQNNLVEMRLNEDDFWESEATGLQITISPPYAIILCWRGKGKFRSSSEKASDIFTGLILVRGKQEHGHELEPDMDKIIENKFLQLFYTQVPYENKEAFKAAKFDPNDPIFEKQTAYLNTLSKDDLHHIYEYYIDFKETGYNVKSRHGDVYDRLHKSLYNAKLIFAFRWVDWYDGMHIINNLNYDYSASTLLDLSMYLTALFRSERFNEGTIEEYFENGVLDKIFERLGEISKEPDIYK